MKKKPSVHNPPSLGEWLDQWEAAVESGQSRISRQEAIKRYHQHNRKKAVDNPPSRSRMWS